MKAVGSEFRGSGLHFFCLGFGDVCGLEAVHSRSSFSRTMQAGGRACLTPSLRLRAHAVHVSAVLSCCFRVYVGSTVGVCELPSQPRSAPRVFAKFVASPWFD